MPSYWMKLYVEILDDPKVARLPDYLWRRFIELCLLAKENDSGGSLQPVTDMAWRLRVEEERLSEHLRALEEVGVVGRIDGRWTVTNFAKRQEPVSVAERVERHRKRTRNEDVTKRYIEEEEETEGESEEEAEEEGGVGGGCAIFRLYEGHIGPVPPAVIDALIAAERDYPAQWLQRAFEIGKGKSWAYVRTILERWQSEGYDGDRYARKTQKERAPADYAQWAVDQGDATDESSDETPDFEIPGCDKTAGQVWSTILGQLQSEAPKQYYQRSVACYPIDHQDATLKVMTSPGDAEFMTSRFRSTVARLLVGITGGAVNDVVFVESEE